MSEGKVRKMRGGAGEVIGGKETEIRVKEVGKVQENEGKGSREVRGN